MELSPYMISVEYNHNSMLLEDKSLPIKQLTVGERVKYDRKNKFWYTKNHYRASIELENGVHQLRFFQIGFKITECDYKDISIIFKSDGIKENLVLTYDEKNDIWFQKSIYQNRKKDGYYVFSDRTKDFLRGLNHAGQLIVEVLRGGELLLSEKVLFLPSSISISQYNIMISDLFRIRESLVKNEKIDITVNTQKEKTIDKLEKVVEEINAPLRYINKFPAANLKIVKDYIKEPSKIRFNPITEIQKKFQPGKPKYKGLVITEDFSIYENRIIKQQLEKIIGYSNLIAEPKLVEAYKTKILHEAQSIIKKNSSRIKTYINNLGGIEKLEYLSLSDLQSKIDLEINKKGEEILRRRKFVESIIESREIFNPTKITQKSLQVRLKLKVFSGFFEKTPYYFQNNVSVTIKPGNLPDSRSPAIRFIGYEYWHENYGWVPQNTLSQYCYIENCSNNKEQLVMLKGFEEVVSSGEINGEGVDVQLIGNVALNDIPFIFAEDIIGLPHNDPKYRYYKFKFCSINSFLLNRTNFTLPVTDNQILSELSKLLIAYDSTVQRIEEHLERLNLEKNAVKKIIKLFNTKDMIQANAQRYEKVFDCIKEFLQLEFFRGIEKNPDTALIPTQLFLHDPNYKKIWKLINDVEEEIGAALIPDSNSGRFGVNKVDEIFEIWSLMKMIYILTKEMGWTITNNNSFIDCIDSYLTSNKKLKGITIEMKLDKWLLELTYEPKVYLEGNSYKKPDYRYLFKEINNWGQYQVIGVVYLDAKYRNYKEQDEENQGEQEWAKDIKKFAMGTYGNMFHTDNPKLKTIASFLMHPDIELGMYKERKGENYFAFYNRQHFPEAIDNQNKEEVHKYGSIFLLPISTYSFNNWFRMIMEFKLNYFQKCWSCGEQNNITKYIKYTASGYPKFHYQCHNCDEFWVKNHCRKHGHKIIKHISNYHRQPSEDNEWYVVCPTCGDGFQYEK